MTNKPSWQDEYDNIFGIKHYQVCVGKKCSCHKEVKAFIQDLLDRKAREIEEHGYRKNEPGWEKISTEVKFYGMGYNDALDQAISILKEEE